MKSNLKNENYISIFLGIALLVGLFTTFSDVRADRGELSQLASNQSASTSVDRS